MGHFLSEIVMKIKTFRKRDLFQLKIESQLFTSLGNPSHL